ncbi:glutamate 5-kinase [Bartonella sp. AR 15-3]|nr:glutamate 5-kinase [Bartonella sp. AR 15-3]
MTIRMQKLLQYKHIEINIASVLLVNPQTGLRIEWLKSLINDAVVLC